MAYRDYALITDADDRGAVAELETWLVQLDGAAHRVDMMHDIAAKTGIPYGSLRRKYYAWKAGGAIAIADKRKIRGAKQGDVLFERYKTLCEQNKESNKGAYDILMRELREGRLIGDKTWRDFWAAENPYCAVPARCPATWRPKGCTYQNLERKWRRDPRRLASLAWVRQGQFAAMKYVVDVPRSRFDNKTGRQLPAGAVYQYDDAWENALVMVPGKKGLFRVLGFHCYDVGTGYHFDPWMKPRDYVVVDGDRVKGNNLTEQMFRMAFGYQMCINGFHRDGVLNVLEKGTTAIREPVRKRIAQIPEYGSLIQFTTSGAANTPAHQGLFIGANGGNPQFKSLVEGGHRIMQRAMAYLPENLGRSAAMKPEWYDNQKKYAEGTLAKLDGLALREDVLPLLNLRFRTFDQYMQIYGAVSDAVNDTPEHRLEGWVKYFVEEFRDPESDTWHPMSFLEELSPVAQDIIERAIAADPAANVRSRRMSRREAFATWSGEMVKVPLCEMQYFMDERDAKVLTVTPKRMVEFSDATFFPGLKMKYTGVCTDRNGLPHMLAPGQKVRVYFNAWIPDRIWVADMDDKPIGMAQMQERAYWTDTEHIKRLAGAKLHDMAYMLSDTRSRNVGAAAEKIAGEAAARILVETARQVAHNPAPDGEGYDFEELAGTASCETPVTAPDNADALAFLDQMATV